MIKKPSYAPDLKDEENEDQWKEKVSEWRNDLQELGILKDRNQALAKIRTASATSILACLQSPI